MNSYNIFLNKITQRLRDDGLGFVNAYEKKISSMYTANKFYIVEFDARICPAKQFVILDENYDIVQASDDDTEFIMCELIKRIR
jgi:signal peptidase I